MRKLVLQTHTLQDAEVRRIDQQLERLQEDVRSYRAQLGEHRRDELDEKLGELRSEFYRKGLEAVRNTGIDFAALERLTREEAQLIRQDLQRSKAASSEASRQNERLLLQMATLEEPRGASITEDRTPTASGWIYPPAVRCEPTREIGGPDQDEHAISICTSAISELDMLRHSTGLGGSWGKEAIPQIPSLLGTIVYIYIPPTDGDLEIAPWVKIQGHVYVIADGHFWSRTEAQLDLTMRYNLYQNYWETWVTDNIVTEHQTQAKRVYDVDRWSTTNLSTTVTANAPVYIWIQAELYAYGRSDYAYAEGDFFTGEDRFIRVPGIWFNFYSAIA